MTTSQQSRAEAPAVTASQAHSAVIHASAVNGIPELLEKSVIKTDQDGIRRTLVKVDASIHANAVQCLLHAEKHGDTSLFRRLLIDIVEPSSGYRRQGLIAWMRRFSPLELHGDVIKLTGTINGVPIPFDIETANRTPFTKIPEFAEMVAWRPMFKGGVVGKIERAMKEYKAAVENTVVENGHVVGPKDPKKPFYNGIHLDRMDTIFDKIEAATKEFETFADDTAEVAEARKARANADAFLKSKEKVLETQIASEVAPVQGEDA
jgi:hypothetical protein